jgi:hydroxymethylpyrimidine/phosphomethylpyrimidine kinase
LGPTDVLLKGDHMPGEASPDLLAKADGLKWLPGPRHGTPRTHGTGCTLSSVLATLQGHGMPLAQAASAAKACVARAIATADALPVGTVHGPIHYFQGNFQGATR